MLEGDSQPGASNKLPNWAWGILAVLAAYQALMYGWVMRIYMSQSVVVVPWLLNQPDYRLYESVILPYTPASLWLQAFLYRIIPDALLRNRLAMIVLVITSMGLVFWLARRWWGTAAGITGAVLYAAWGPAIMERPMYFDVLLGVVILCAVMVWHDPDVPRWRSFAAGLIVGIGVLVKQHGLAIIAVFVLWRVLAFDRKHLAGDIFRFLFGAALPVGGFLLLMVVQGRLEDALFWTWTYIWGPFIQNAARWPGGRELLIIAAWLMLLPLFMRHAIPRWNHRDILLLGLLPVLVLLAFPRYSRFHLSGAVPIVALIGAGAVAYARQIGRENQDKETKQGLSLTRLYLIGVTGCCLVVLALPTYYRIRLGPRIGEYEDLIPIGTWLADEAGVPAGTRVWLLPDIDPTTNFYVLGGYLPPTLYSLSEPWYHAVPGFTEHVIASLETDPPEYAILLERWRADEPEALLNYLEAHYTPVGEMAAPGEYGQVTFYTLK